MRHLTKLLLTAGLAVVFVSITLAQPGPGGRGGFQMTEATLLANKSVQEELKLDKDVLEKIKTINDKMQADIMDAGKDRAKIQAAREAASTETGKLVEKLSEKQQKRLLQIFVQANLNPPTFGKQTPTPNTMAVFGNEQVQKELKFTDDQKKMVKTIVEDTKKDVAEIQKGLTKDSTKDERAEATKKIADLNTKATEKITTSLTDDQKKLWKDLPGDKFELKMEFPGGPGKDKKKDN